jgi:tetratricopeptide (TPR) repeat protein
MLGMLVARRPELDPEPRPLARRGSAQALAIGIGVALVIGCAGATLTRQGLADRYRSHAFEQIRSDPVAAIRDADRSLRLDRNASQTYYAKAAALARMGEGAPATATLLEAARREPSNWVTWGLLRDAARYYGRALRLNPLDPGLQSALKTSKDDTTP